MKEKEEVRRSVFSAFVKRASAKRYAAVAALASAVMTMPALATDTENELSDIFNQMPNIATLLTNVWTMMTANAYLTFMLATGLLSIGIGVFRKVKRVARH